MKYGLCMVVALAAVLAASAADQKSDEEKFKDTLHKSGQLEGKITQVDTTAKGLTVDVVQKLSKPNLQAQQNLISLQQQLISAQRSRNAAQIASIQAEIVKNKNSLNSTEDRHYKLEIQTNDHTRIRQKNPPVNLDDKGKPKKYTQKELSALKGKGSDRYLEGYTAEFDNLKVGQKVKVWFKKPQPARASDKDAAHNKSLTATMIVIVEEPK